MGTGSSSSPAVPPETTKTRPPRPDWRETLTGAADLALIGIAVTAIALGVLTAPAALVTGSVAVHDWCEHRKLPELRSLGRTFVRALLPGLVAAVVVLGAAAVLAFDLRAIAIGAVPGGTAMLVATWVIAGAVVATLALTLVRLGGQPGGSWRGALAWAVRTLIAAPLIGPALVAVIAAGALIGVMIPVTAPLAVGYVLLGLHVITARLLRANHH